MEKSTILTADVLDILFEGRNKAYGAYDLRKTYNKRMTVSITVMLSSVCLMSMGFAFSGKKGKAAGDIIQSDTVTLIVIEPPVKPIEPPPPPALKPPAPPQDLNIKTLKNTVYKIVQDNQVSENERPPEVKDLETARIGAFNSIGGEDEGLVIAPPGDPKGTTGVTEIKRDDEDDDGIFVSVQIESEYPGGTSAWQRFLNRNLRYPQDAIDQGVEGFVTVQFVVDKEGNVSNVEAVSGPAELRAEAIRVIKKSGKWTPAIQNGRQVKSYKKQPIGFRLNVD
ncbi:energy transducer TonB [Niastella populi]|uniref:Energy transducer TonB n=1 Tax=Niastella populi TaxID=550983 RepID=A0A1V9EKW3_9BACT|nr:energy transducer TonB [Niastella populi]OQP46779.1 energy transducer TonB [Niastella populi]